MANNQQINVLLKLAADAAGVQQEVNKVQKVLSGLQLPPNLQNSFKQTFNKLEGDLTKFQSQLKNGFSKKGDVTGLETTAKNINQAFDKLMTDMSKVQGMKIEDIFKLSPEGLKQIESYNQQIKQFQEQMQGVLKLSNQGKGALQNLLGKDTTKGAQNAAQLIEQKLAAKEYAEALELVNQALKRQEAAKTAKGKTANIRNNINNFTDLKKAIEDAIKSTEQIQGKINNIETAKAEMIGKAMTDTKVKIDSTANSVEIISKNVRNLGQESADAANDMYSMTNQIDQLKNRVAYFFSLTNAVNLFKRAVTSAFNTVKELDATMTEAAVVTDFSVGDMWEKLPQYSAGASKLGAKINDLYGATTLYYQQGLKTNEAMALGTETMKMARIAGMEAEDATKAMTAALRGFNMELNETSATRVNDVYSELAAITAADTEQIATAMSKTASIAANANMEFESTAAFLSQIIETTQEAPETAGTALKTIIARFSEVKSLREKGLSSGEDSEGELIDVNKIQSALRTVGISMDEFFAGTEGLDSVLMKLASKWETLDFETQRYIATTAAGSRQQSRFIAMMSDYDRTMELAGAANNSAGASQEQFNKTLESLEAKLNNLKNAWDQFLMGLSNNTIIKGVIDLLTNFLNGINSLIDGLSGGNGLIKSILSLGIAIGGIKIGKSVFNKILGSIGAAFSNGGKQTGKSFTDAFVKSVGKHTGRIRGLFKGIKLDNSLEKTILKVSNTTKTAKTEVEDFNKRIFTMAAAGRKTTSLEAGLSKSTDTLKKSTAELNDLQRIQSVYTKANTDQQLAFNSAMNAGASAQQAEMLLTSKSTKEDLKQVAAKMLGAEATEEEIEAKYQEMLATQLTGKFNGKFLKEKTLETALRLANTLGLKGESSSKLVNTIATKINTAAIKAQTAEEKKEIAVKIAKLGIIGLIILAIIALIAVVVLLSKAIANSTDAAKIKKLKEEVKELSSAFEDATSKLNELTEAKAGLDEMRNKISELTKGTTEWSQAIADNNLKVLELLNTYNGLKLGERGANGELTIDESSWDAVISQQQKAVLAAQTSIAQTNMRIEKIENKGFEEEIKTKRFQGAADRDILGSARSARGNIKDLISEPIKFGVETALAPQTGTARSIERMTHLGEQEDKRAPKQKEAEMNFSTAMNEFSERASMAADIIREGTKVSSKDGGTFIDYGLAAGGSMVANALDVAGAIQGHLWDASTAVTGWINQASTDVGDWVAGAASDVGNWFAQAGHDIAGFFGIDTGEVQKSDLRGDRERKRNGGLTDDEMTNLYGDIAKAGLSYGLDGSGADDIYQYLQEQYGDDPSVNIDMLMDSIHNLGSSFDELAIKAMENATAQEQQSRAIIASVAASNESVTQSGYSDAIENLIYSGRYSDEEGYDDAVEAMKNSKEFKDKYKNEKAMKEAYAIAMGYVYDKGSDKIYTDASQSSASEVDISKESIETFLASSMVNENLSDSMTIMAQDMAKLPKEMANQFSRLTSQEGAAITNEDLFKMSQSGEFNLDQVAIEAGYANAAQMADAWGISLDQLTETISKNIEVAQERLNKKRNEVARKIQKNNKKYKGESGEQQLVTDYANLEKRFEGRFTDLYTIAENALISAGNETFSSEFLNKLINDSLSGEIDVEEFEEINSMLNNLDFSNPIASQKELNQYLKRGTEAQKQYAKEILNTSSGMFSLGNQLSYLWSSDSFSEARTEIEELIEANEEISADNIVEFADECSELSDLMKQTGATAEGLAKIFNLVNDEMYNGKYTFENLGSAVIAAIGSVGGHTQFLKETVEDFTSQDFGIDEGSLSDSMKEYSETIDEHLKANEYGNTEMRNIMKYLLGSEFFKNDKGEDLTGEDYYNKVDEGAALIKKLADNPLYLIDQASQGKTLTGEEVTDTSGPSFKKAENGGYDFVGYEEYFSEEGHDWGTLITDLAKKYGTTEEVMSQQMALFSNYGDFSQYKESYDKETAAARFLEQKEIVDTGSKVSNFAYTDYQGKTRFGTRTGEDTERYLVDEIELQALVDEGIYDSQKEALEALQEQADGTPIKITNFYDEEGALKQGAELASEVSEVVDGQSLKKTKKINGGRTTLYDGIDVAELEEQMWQIFDTQQEVDAAMDAAFENGVDGITEMVYTASDGTTHVLDTAASDWREQVNQIEKDVENAALGEAIAEAISETEITITVSEESKTDVDEATDSIDNLSSSADTATTTTENLSDNMTTLGESARIAASKIGNIKTQLDQLPTSKTVTVKVTETGGGATAAGTAFAHGGFNGTEAGEALVGELGPEMVVDPHSGQWYTVGDDGAEFTNLPKDAIIFNHKQTEGILNNGHIFGRGKALASGNAYSSNPNAKNPNSSTDSKRNRNDNDSDSDDGIWEIPYDTIHNFLETLEELTRDLEALQNDFDLMASRSSTTIAMMNKNLDEQLKKLDEQRKNQEEILKIKKQELKDAKKGEYIATRGEGDNEKEVRTTFADQAKYLGVKNLDDYITYDANGGIQEIVYDKIEAIEDKDKQKDIGELVEAYYSHLEDLEESIEEAEDGIREIEDQVNEIINNQLEARIDYIEQMRQMLIDQEQQKIDDMQSLSDTLSESNSSILDSLQQSIDLERQIRDNTKQEEDIADMEARLAYLRRDTSGANQQEILQLEEQLGDARQSYSDSLVDQQLQKLSDENAAAEEQRQQQIDLAQAQLDYMVESGYFNDMVTAMNKSEALALWKEMKNYDAQTEEEKIALMQEFNQLFNKGNSGGEELAKADSMYKGDKYTLTDASRKTYKNMKYDSATDSWTNGKVTISAADISEANINDNTLTTKKDLTKKEESTEQETPSNPSSESTSSAKGYISGLKGGKVYKNGTEEIEKFQKGINTLVADGKLSVGKLEVDGSYGPKTKAAAAALQKKIGVTADSWWGSGSQSAFKKSSLKAYKTGGVADFTGPAWLDGTKSKPEIILNQQDSKNFIMLKDVLAEILQGATSTKSGQKSGGDNYFDISIIVDEISSDYDVDQMAARIKQQIYDDSTYRNVNAINLIR